MRTTTIDFFKIFFSVFIFVLAPLSMALGDDLTSLDTDGDGISDSDEIRCGSDPLDPQSRCNRGMPWLLLLLEDDSHMVTGLSIENLGNGHGTVTSSPSGINCGSTCSANFTSGTSVTLTATPASGSIFVEWGGACSGSNTACTVTLSQARSVTATFNTQTTTIGTVTSLTGRVWMDRNLGATRVATAYNDPAAYGDLYQWGRGTDGHEKRTSPTITTLSSSDTPGHGSFITTSSIPLDWRNPQNDSLWQGVSGVNNPCPSGFRLPTSTEWEEEQLTWSTSDVAGAYASPLKLVSAGNRNGYDGAIYNAGSFGYYWSSSLFSTSVDGNRSRNLFFDIDRALNSYGSRANGASVRCIQDYSTVQHNVTAYAGTGGSVSPATLIVNDEDSASFTVTPLSGYTTNTSVGGTCPSGNWSDNIYTTGAITDDCSVSFSFNVIAPTTYTLPDTGQTTCYDSAGTTIDCAGTGQDGEFSINPMSYNDNGNSTVTDNNTGLIWQQVPSVNSHSWQDSITYCDGLTLGGSSDWRLPTRRELISIVDYGGHYHQAINPVFSAISAPYWSASPYANDSSLAWYVSFHKGSFLPSSKDSTYSVRCVKGVTSPEPFYTANGNGTVTDEVTGLIWQQNDAGTISWIGALDYCNSLDLGGNSNWRLPNIKELESILDISTFNPAANPLFNASSSFYWTSTSSTDFFFTPAHAEVVRFSYGENMYSSKLNTINTRCVR